MLDLERVDRDVQRLMDDTMRIQAQPQWKSFAYALAFLSIGVAIARMFH